VTAAALLKRLRARGVIVHADGNRLRLRPANAVTDDEVEALRRLKPEILRMLRLTLPTEAAAAALPNLDADAVREVLGPCPDAHAAACIAWDVLDAVREIQVGIRDGVLPRRRLIEGRPLADWLPLDDLVRLLSEGATR
jgi:hypothetical protein